MFSLRKLFESKSKNEELHRLLDVMQKMDDQNKYDNLTDKEKIDLEKYKNRVDRGLTEYEMDRVREKIKSVDI